MTIIVSDSAEEDQQLSGMLSERLQKISANAAEAKENQRIMDGSGERDEKLSDLVKRLISDSE